MSWLSVVASAVRTTSITSTPPAPSWSCTCAGQTLGQVVNATTKCGTPMCPNWQTTTTRTTTRVDTRPLFTFTDPPLLTFPRASCACSKPTVEGVGVCSTVHNSYFSGATADGYHCACESTKVVDWATVCGQTMCPNAKQMYTAPTTCGDSECIWPTNTNLGQCQYAAVSTITVQAGGPGRQPLNKHTELVPYPDIDFCLCDGQGTTVVNAMPGCNTNSRICGNQKGIVTASWHTAPLYCPFSLPRLPWFESCGVTVSSWTQTEFKGPFPNEIHRSSTFCTCNKPGETDKYDSSYVIPIVRRLCDMSFLCHNSEGMTAGAGFTTIPRELERATTATAAGPLLAVSTGATPGSVPMAAAEPTVLMAV